MPSEFDNMSVDEIALKRLEELESQEALQSEKPKGDESTDDAKLADDRAPAVEDPEAKVDTKESDTQSDIETVDQAKANADKEGKELALDEKGQPKRDEKGQFVKQDKKPVEQSAPLTAEERLRFDKYLAEAQGSKYAKDFNRRQLTWKELNQHKEEFAAQQTKTKLEFEAAKAKFNADYQAFKAEQESTRPTPEKYEAFANKQIALANQKEVEAKNAEEAGEFDRAEALRDEAKFARRDADAATKSADYVRKNPPVNDQQRQAQFQEHQKQWINKAAIDFPEFAKKDSNVQKLTAETYKQFTAQHPESARLPGLVYYCARVAAAESVSARVPALEKELSVLRNKVKELEQLTNPTGTGSVARTPAKSKKFEDLSEQEQLAQLMADAADR